MGGIISVVKTLIVPAVISLILFLVSTYVLLPLYRRYRQRYSQYLPIDRISDRISDRTSGFRYRVQTAIASMMMPSMWRRNRVVIAEANSEDGFESEEGEELGDVGDDWDRDRELPTEPGHERPDLERRLSRDLEEGFRDDSEEEDDDRRDSRVRL